LRAYRRGERLLAFTPSNDEGISVSGGPPTVPFDFAALRAANPDVNLLILDDGLQHYRLRRDLEIAVVDGRGVGNGFLLPAGPLREPVTRLQEVDAVVRLVAPDVAIVSGTDARHTRMRHLALPWRNLRESGRSADPATWRGLEVHAVCGTANPARFFAMLRAQGIAAKEHPFPDHHRFVPGDLAFPGAVAILMTQKDAVKCEGFADARSWYLPVRAELDPALTALVEDTIRGFKVA